MPVHGSNNITGPGSTLNLTLSVRSLNSSHTTNMIAYNNSSSGNSNVTIHCASLGHTVNHYRGSISARSILAARNVDDDGPTIGGGEVIGIIVAVVAFCILMLFMVKWARGSHKSAWEQAQARHQQGGWVKAGTMRAGGGKRGYSDFGADFPTALGEGHQPRYADSEQSRYAGRVPRQAGSRSGPRFPSVANGTNFNQSGSMRAAQRAAGAFAARTPGPYGQAYGSQSRYA